MDAPDEAAVEAVAQAIHGAVMAVLGLAPNEWRKR